MSSFGKGIPLASGFDLGAKIPLDSRSYADTIAERDMHITNNRVYEGMQVYVKEDKTLYRWNGESWDVIPTKEYIDEMFENIEIDGGQLGDHYNKTEIDGMMSEINTTLDNKADNLFQSNMLTVSSLGGIPAGTDLNNMSIQDVLTKLLYPYVPPTVSATITYTPVSSAYEYGQTITVTKMTVNITKKSENIIQLNYYVNNELYASDTNVSSGGSFSINFTDNIAITKSISNSYFQAKVVDASGKTVTSNTIALNFYYPYYYGVINEDVEITENLIKGLTKQVVAKGNKTYVYNTDYQKMVIAYPKSYGLLKSILDPNGFEQLAAFEVTEIAIVGLDGTSQTYYVYANEPSTNTNFTMKFNY